MSSEALERAERIRENISHVARGCRSASSHNPAPYLNTIEAALVALLAELARLEQELRDARQGWDGWQAQCLAAEAALAVAREREQRLEVALQEAVFLLDHLTVEDIAARSRRSILVAIKFARAALGEEPAAATTRECPNCNGFGKVRDSVRIEPVTCGRCDGYGVIPAATLAGPDERPGGAAVTRSLDADTQSRLLSPASGSASAAADERICGNCDGLGLLDERDEWGFGKPCPRCNGTGAAARRTGRDAVSARESLFPDGELARVVAAIAAFDRVNGSVDDFVLLLLRRADIAGIPLTIEQVASFLCISEDDALDIFARLSERGFIEEAPSGSPSGKEQP